jgi:hypothetical protein
MIPFLVHVLFTFYILDVLKFKCVKLRCQKVKVKHSIGSYFPGVMDSEHESGTIIRQVGNILQSTCGDIAGKLKRIPP